MIIVSVGLIKARLSNAPKIARDLMSGSMKPNKVIFCISSEPYMLDDGIKRNEVKRWHGASFKIVKNTGPIRRIAPVVKEFWNRPETKIITIDDDRRPSPDMVANLVNYSNKHPNKALSIAGNKLTGYDNKPHWKNKGVIYDTRHHKDVGIVLGWKIKQPITVDILNPGVGMLVKPKFFTPSFFNWEKTYNKSIGIDRTDQTFISYSLQQNKIQRVVIKSSYVGEYPSHGKRLCGITGKPFNCLYYKKKQLNLFFRTNFKGVPQL